MIPAAMKTMMDLLNAVRFLNNDRFFSSQKTNIGYAVIAIAIIGGQRITLLSFFQCPCNVKQNMAYGFLFLLVPALMFFTVGIVLSTHLWRLYMGCCLNPRKLCPQGRNCMGCLTVLFDVTVEVLMAPILWLSITLLDGTFYVCAVRGVEEQVFVDWLCKNKISTCKYELAKVPCNMTNLPPVDIRELLLMLHTQSRILGSVLAMGSILAALIYMCYRNCTSQVSSLQLTFWKGYKDKESGTFESSVDEYATKLADRNVKSFFENKDPEAFSFTNYKAWEQISALHTYNHGEQSYSTLQRYVEAPSREYSPEKVQLAMKQNL